MSEKIPILRHGKESGRYAIVDENIHHVLSGFNWIFSTPDPDSVPRTIFRLNNKPASIVMSRLVIALNEDVNGTLPTDLLAMYIATKNIPMVKHIDGNKHNCQYSNLSAKRSSRSVWVSDEVLDTIKRSRLSGAEVNYPVQNLPPAMVDEPYVDPPVLPPDTDDTLAILKRELGGG